MPHGSADACFQRVCGKRAKLPKVEDGVWHDALGLVVGDHHLLQALLVTEVKRSGLSQLAERC